MTIMRNPKLTKEDKERLRRINENLRKWHDAMKILDNIENEWWEDTN